VPYGPLATLLTPLPLIMIMIRRFQTKAALKQRSNPITWVQVLAALVFVVSWGLFLSFWGVAQSPQVNADMLIHALMAERFDWSRDAYYWGQDRLGSLLPFLGSILTASGLDGLTAMAWVQGLVLLGCGLLWAYLERDVLMASVGLAFLMLPPYPFEDGVNIGHPYLSQYVLGLGLLALLEAARRANEASIVPKSNASTRPFSTLNIRSFGLVVLVVANLWASELSLALLAAAAWFYRGTIIQLSRDSPWAVFLGASSGLLGLWLAKSGAPQQKGFAKLIASPHEVLQSLASQWTEWSTTLMGGGNKPFNTLFWWAFLVAMLGLVVFGWLRPKRIKALTWTLGLASLGSWAVVHLSGWSAVNGFPLRYFSAAFGFGGLAVLSCLSDLGISKKPFVRAGTVALLVMQVWAAWSFNRTFSTGAKGRLTRVQAEVLLDREGRSDDTLAFIASYWNSYLLDGLSPQAIGIPHENDHCRERRYLNEVLDQNEIIAIAAGWVEVLPDTLQQYGVTWIKMGETQTTTGTDYARYSKQKALR